MYAGSTFIGNLQVNTIDSRLKAVDAISRLKKYR